jgi:heme/copper-type cytochrome/quinol oxidase subunit 3
MSEVRPYKEGVVSTPEERAYEARAAEGAIWSGSRLLLGIYAFAFAALAFAYFYLRSSNNENLWRPHDMTAPTGTGAAIMALAVAAAALSGFGLLRFRRDMLVDWQVTGWAAVGAGLIALGLQAWELTALPFFPSASGYASCFIGWAGMNMVLLASGIYWTETLLARHARLSRALAEEGASPTAHFTTRRFRVNVEASVNMWMFIAAVSVFFWIFFYVAR